MGALWGSEHVPERLRQGKNAQKRYLHFGAGTLMNLNLSYLTAQATSKAYKQAKICA